MGLAGSEKVFLLVRTKTDWQVKALLPILDDSPVVHATDFSALCLEL